MIIHKRPISSSTSAKIEYLLLSVDLDLTGSPLKAGFDPNEVFDNSVDDLLTIRPKKKKPTHRFLNYFYLNILCNSFMNRLSELWIRIRSDPHSFWSKNWV